MRHPHRHDRHGRDRPRPPLTCRHEPRAARDRRDRLEAHRGRRHVGQRHGTAPLVFLVVAGLLAAITMRSTRGGARAASWLAVLTVVAIGAGLMEPAQQRIVLFQDRDLLLALTLYASYVAWIALAVASVIRSRDTSDSPASASSRS